MSLRLSRQTFIPVGAFAVLAGVIATFMLARLPSPAEPQSSLVRPKLATTAPARKPAAKKAAPAPAAKPKAKAKAKAPAALRPKAPVRTPAKPKPVTPAVVPAAPVRKPDPKPVVEDGLPLVLKAALAKDRVVVVALYDPAAGLDEMALAEARDGARAAGVGFLAINVFNEKVSRRLVEELGALESPSVLVFQRPEKLFARIDGFVDRDSVAQAAANARR